MLKKIIYMHVWLIKKTRIYAKARSFSISHDTKKSKSGGMLRGLVKCSFETPIMILNDVLEQPFLQYCDIIGTVKGLSHDNFKYVDIF